MTASTPIKEQGAENADKPRRKKKTNNRSSTNAEESTLSAASENGSKLSKSSLKKAESSTGGSSKDRKKIKKKTSTSAEESLMENSTTKSSSKKSSKASKSSISSDIASPEVKTVQVEVNNMSSADNPFPQASISVDEVDGTFEMERNDRSRRSSSPKSRYRLGEQEGEAATTTEIVEKKVKRKRPSAKGGEVENEDAAGATKEKVRKKKLSAKGGEGESEDAVVAATKEKVRKKRKAEVGEGDTKGDTKNGATKEKAKKKKSLKKAKGGEGNTVDGPAKEKVKKKKPKHKESEKQEDAEKITVGVIAKEKAKPKGEDSDGKKKRKKSKEESSSRKTSRDQSQSPSRKASTTKEDVPAAIEEMPAAEQPLSLSVDVPPPQSAAISGSIESNTLTFVSTKKGSKSSLNQLGDGEEEVQLEKEHTNTLPRSKSANLSRRSSRDTSEFRNELREASRSQHDMPEAVATSVTIEIDPNIKVKRSGLVKGKNLSRPSIFDQSSSPEPEEVTPISSGPVEDNLLDSEFKVKKSGVVQGRKASATTRPSILDEKETKTTPVGKFHIKSTTPP